MTPEPWLIHARSFFITQDIAASRLTDSIRALDVLNMNDECLSVGLIS